MIYERFHILNCGFEIKWAIWSSQLWTQFKQLRKEAWKSQDFKGVQLLLFSFIFLSMKLGFLQKNLCRATFAAFISNPSSNPLKSWLFQASICNCLNCIHNCDDHSSLDYVRNVREWLASPCGTKFSKPKVCYYRSWGRKLDLTWRKPLSHTLSSTRQLFLKHDISSYWVNLGSKHWSNIVV